MPRKVKAVKIKYPADSGSEVEEPTPKQAKVEPPAPSVTEMSPPPPPPSPKKEPAPPTLPPSPKERIIIQKDDSWVKEKQEMLKQFEKKEKSMQREKAKWEKKIKELEMKIVQPPPAQPSYPTHLPKLGAQRQIKQLHQPPMMEYDEQSEEQYNDYDDTAEEEEEYYPIFHQPNKYLKHPSVVREKLLFNQIFRR